MKKHDTVQNFITAFWQLYEEKPIEKISISRLCQLAGYNRATFYNHFENIYNLFENAVHDILFPIKRDVLSVQSIYSLLQGDLIINILSTYFHQQDKYIKLLFKRRDHYILGEQIKKELLLNISENAKFSDASYEKIKILLEYHISAVLGVINYWYQNGQPISEEEILEEIYNISSEGVLNSLRLELSKLYK